MILEGIVTTPNLDGSTNISPMGPIVDAAFSRLQLRPFQTSTTYVNLKRERRGVFHVTDDAELLARAAIGQWDEPPALNKCESAECMMLAGACRWYAFEVETLDDAEARTRIECRVLGTGRNRDFFGWNRAKHAVLEAAILATRLQLLPREAIWREFASLRAPVEKTAGPSERRAFQLLCEYVGYDPSQ